MRDKLQLKRQSLETTAPSVIRCQTTNIETQTSPQHGAGSLLFAQLRPCSPFWKAMMMICMRYQHNWPLQLHDHIEESKISSLICYGFCLSGTF